MLIYPDNLRGMSKLQYLILVAIMHSVAWAQSPSVPGYLSQLTFPMVEVDVEGSPYYNDSYRLGQVFFEGEKHTFFFRFNAFKDRIELKDRTMRLYHLKKNEIIEPVFGGKIYQLKSYFEDEVLKLGYFIPLNKGKAVLYIKPKKVFVQAKKPDNGYGEYTPPHYKDVSGYYLQLGNSLPSPIKLSKRSILNVLGAKHEDLEEYSNRNQLDLRNEKDVVRLFNFYNRI
jgi:hypothetical protein